MQRFTKSAGDTVAAPASAFAAIVPAPVQSAAPALCTRVRMTPEQLHELVWRPVWEAVMLVQALRDGHSSTLLVRERIIEAANAPVVDYGFLNIMVDLIEFAAIVPDALGSAAPARARVRMTPEQLAAVREALPLIQSLRDGHGTTYLFRERIIEAANAPEIDYGFLNIVVDLIDFAVTSGGASLDSYLAAKLHQAAADAELVSRLEREKRAKSVSRMREGKARKRARIGARVGSAESPRSQRSSIEEACHE